MNLNQEKTPFLVINKRFSVIKQLGQGGFGNVFLVNDYETNEICALKLIKPELAMTPGIQAKFKEEATTWMAFGKHPNIVNVRSVDIFNGQLFIALEYVPPGETGVNCLDKLITQRRVSTRKALIWAIQLCDALVYAKSKGMVAHRDLKPSNIMVCQDDSIKVTDFGLAIFSVDPNYKAIDLSPSGTPAYMPPEGFHVGNLINQRIDVYSFGIVLYEILSGGNLPFNIGNIGSDNYFDYFMQIHATYKLPKMESPLFPVIERCLKKQPEERYGSFSEILCELEFIYHQVNGNPYVRSTKEEISASEYINLATSYQMLGDKKSALMHIEHALRLAPGYPKALNNKAALLMEMGMIKEGLKIWEQLIQTNPELGRPYYNIGNFLMGQGSSKQAVEFFEKAIRREPDYVPALVNLAIAYHKLRDAQNAIHCYERALNISPMDAQIHYNFGFLCYEIGKLDSAVDFFTNTLELNPNHLSAINYLGLCYLNQRKPEKTLEFFERALAIDPNYRYAQDNKDIAKKMCK